MIKKRGKTPSFITSLSGKPKVVQARGKRTCKRGGCGEEIPKGTKCVEVPQPGTMGARTFCVQCIKEIIQKSREDLNELEKRLS